jgi:hypothetical protein
MRETAGAFCGGCLSRPCHRSAGRWRLAGLAAGKYALRVSPRPHPAPSDGDQDPLLAAAVRLVRRRRWWGWTTLAAFIAFLIAMSVYSSRYSDATGSGPVAILAIALAIAALTVTGAVIVVATSVQLGRRTAAQRAQAISRARHNAARRSRAGRLDWLLASGLLVAGLGAAVLFLPGLVNGVAYLSRGNMATFVPRGYAQSCSTHGGCSTVTVGFLRTGGGSVSATWPHKVPLGRPFQVREPVWTWGLGSALINGDGIAVGAALISLLFDGLALLATIYFIKVVRSRLDRAKRKDPAPGLS